MDPSTKVNGSMVRLMGKAFSFIAMEIFMKVILRQIKLRGMVFILMWMDQFIEVNGKQI